MNAASGPAAPVGTVPDIEEGAIVLAQMDGLPVRLAIVTGLDDEDTARVITPGHGDDGGLVTRLIPRHSLTPAPRELDAAQQDLAWRLVLRLAAGLRSDVTRLGRQADQALVTITSMRAYAIDKHLDGTICREGLNEFLAAHDLDLYQPRHSARVTISLTVEVADAETEREVIRAIRNALEVSSDDDNVEVGVVDIQVSGVEELSGD